MAQINIHACVRTTVTAYLESRGLGFDDFCAKLLLDEAKNVANGFVKKIVNNSKKGTFWVKNNVFIYFFRTTH